MDQQLAMFDIIITLAVLYIFWQDLILKILIKDVSVTGWMIKCTMGCCY